MITGIILFIGISLLIFVHELGHFIAAKEAGIKVEEFGFGFPPRLKGWRRGETLYSINWLPFGGFVRIYGESKFKAEEDEKQTGEKIEESRAFYARSKWRRFVIIAAGIAINFIVGWLLLSTVYFVGDRQRVEITEIRPGSPAEVFDIKVGDELIGFSSADEFVAFTKNHGGEKLNLSLLRDGVSISREPMLRGSAVAGEGLLGAAVSDFGFKELSFFSALYKGFIDSVSMVAEIFRSLGGLVLKIFTTASLPSDVVGPVGIFSMAGEIGRLGFVYVLQVLAMISLNLAALNALPIPALDGGRILFIVIEKLRGKTMNPKREIWANLICFGLLILLMLVITGRDIVRLF
jgi:regulator of sigma E protease